MKPYLKSFVHRGFLAGWGGPAVLAVIYLVLHACGDADTISLYDAAKGILTITVLAFVAGGITTIYQIERLPLFPALLIHGIVLYAAYLTVYLINGWLADGRTPVIIFTVCFVLGYAVIWLCIYWFTKRKTQMLNKALKDRV